MREHPEEISVSEEVRPRETTAVVGLELRDLLEENQLRLDVLHKRRPFDNTLDPYTYKPGQKETATKILKEYTDSLIELNSFIEEQLDPDKVEGDMGHKYRSIAAKLQSLGEGIDTTSSIRTRTLLVIDYAKQLDKRVAIYSNRLNPRPSDVRRGAKHYELVIATNPETGKSGRFLYWWDGEEVKIEQVNIVGEHTPDTKTETIEAGTKEQAEGLIGEDINNRAERLEIIRNTRLSEVTRPQLIEDLDQRRGDVEDERETIRNIKKSIEGKRYRRSVSGPSLERRLEKYRDELLPKALNEYEMSLNRLNDSLNDRISIKRTGDDAGVFDRYGQLGKELAKLFGEETRGATSVEEKYRLLKKYDKILKERLETFDKLAEKRGLAPLGKRKEKVSIEKPREKPVEKIVLGKRKRTKRLKVDETVVKKGKRAPPILEKEPVLSEELVEKRVESKPPKTADGGKKQPDSEKNESWDLYGRLSDEYERLSREGISTQRESEFPPGKTEAEEVRTMPAKVEEKKPFLDQIADEIKDKRSVQTELSSSELKKIFRGIIEELLLAKEDVRAKADVDVKIKNEEGIVSTSIQVETPVEADINISAILSNSQEPGRLILKSLAYKVKAGFFSRVKLVLANNEGKVREKFENPNEPLLEELNRELEPKGARLSEVELTLGDNSLIFSATGDKV